MANDKQLIIADFRQRVEDTRRTPLYRANKMKKWYVQYPSTRSYRAGKSLSLELRQNTDPAIRRLGEDLRLFIIRRTIKPRKPKPEIAPPGATLKVPDSNGVWHWSNEKHEDLGVINDD